MREGDNLDCGQTNRRDSAVPVDEMPAIIWRFAVLAFTVTGFAGGILRQSMSKGVMA